MNDLSTQAREMIERLESFDTWRGYRSAYAANGDYQMSEEFDDAPKEAAELIRNLLAEREGDQGKKAYFSTWDSNKIDRAR